jgi:hypothetical protein
MYIERGKEKGEGEEKGRRRVEPLYLFKCIENVIKIHKFKFPLQALSYILIT